MNKKKRFYKLGEVVYVKPEKTFGTIKGLNINPADNVYKATVEIRKPLEGATHIKQVELDLWDIDKDKRKYRNNKKDVVLFAKVKENAIIPSKEKEDAGYDIYACIEEDLLLKVGVPTLVPTGIASAFPSTYYMNTKHERGSTGKVGMSVLSGVIDSGYRGEWFVNIVPTHKDILLTNNYDFPTKDDGTPKPVELEDKYIYPASLAIAQATLDIVPDVIVKEIPYEELKDIPSKRGTGKLGDSGK